MPPRGKYPGLGLPLRTHDQLSYGFYPIGAHGNCRGSDSDLIPVRELAAMDVMENLTDKDNWHQKIFNEDVVAKWREEALALPDDYFWDLATEGKLRYEYEYDDDDRSEDPHRWRCKLENIMDEATFQTCVEELRSKAKYYEISGVIPTLEASASIAKSDTIVSTELHDGLQAAFHRLKTDHAASPDWHPKSNSMVQDLVHPSMYPLVYGRTLGFQAEQVGVADAIKQWAGKGSLIPKETTMPSQDPRDRWSYAFGGSDVPPSYWSETYQWLPANVALKKDGGVRFTSYVNNLHPTKYPEIYRTIEKLIEKSIPMWDQCLRMAVSFQEYQGAGRLETRSGPYDHPDDHNAENWIPDNAEACADVECNEDGLENYGYHPSYFEEEDEEKREALWEAKWCFVRKPKIPPISYKHIDYAPHANCRLVEKFSSSGLQVIVKMASIELTPEKPEFPVGGWHVEGQMNEHICATALYYLDSENVSENSLSFRMQTSYDISEDPGFQVGQNSYSWLEQIYGTQLSSNMSPCLQNYGNVQTRQGRLLAFPNVFQHRVSPFKLVDPTKPGHRRFIALWLVDPTKRIISTANIPPQQITWYKESLLGSDSSAAEAALSQMPPDIVNLLAERGLLGNSGDRGAKLPEELMDFVRGYFDEGKYSLPMSVEEANEHRTNLMEERSAFVETSESGWQRQTYNFCEH